VSVGRFEQAPKDGPRLVLFLYESQFDATLRNYPLDEGQPPPLWLVLKFLMTAFDFTGDSDSHDALEVMGQGLSALQRNSFLSLANETNPNIIAPLADNPEDLKITFDEANSDLLSKLVSGADEKYRYAVGFPGETRDDRRGRAGLVLTPRGRELHDHSGDYDSARRELRSR
jgi:hypothetical protein